MLYGTSTKRCCNWDHNTYPYIDPELRSCSVLLEIRTLRFRSGVSKCGSFVGINIVFVLYRFYTLLRMKELTCAITVSRNINSSFHCLEEGRILTNLIDLNFLYGACRLQCFARSVSQADNSERSLGEDCITQCRDGVFKVPQVLVAESHL